MTRIATTEQMAKLIRDGSEHGYNRSFPDPEAVIYDLDPQGTHIVSVVLHHEHINGELAPIHYRTTTMMKMRGKDEAYEVFLDVTPELYLELEEVDLPEQMKLRAMLPGAGKTNVSPERS